MINLNLLYSFFICAEHLNISKAAKILGITQPSLSIQMKNLEEQIGTPLFLRNGKSISLTVKGEELLKTSGAYYDLRNEVARISGEEIEEKYDDELRILVALEVERPFVAELVSKIALKERKRLAILAATTQEILAMSKSKKIDILLTHSKMNSNLACLRLDFPVYFATSSRSASRPGINDPANVEKILDYFGEDLIIPTRDSKLGQEYESFRKKNKITRKIILETNIPSCIVRSVASGAGCAFVPFPYVKSSLYQDKIQLIGPQQGFWRHSIYIYSNLTKPELENHPLVKLIRNYV